MRRTQIYLDEDQKRALRAIAADRGANVSDLVRRAIDRFLSEEIPLLDWGTRFDALQARIEAEMPRVPTDSDVHAAVAKAKVSRRIARRV